MLGSARCWEHLVGGSTGHICIEGGTARQYDWYQGFIQAYATRLEALYLKEIFSRRA